MVKAYHKKSQSIFYSFSEKEETSWRRRNQACSGWYVALANERKMIGVLTMKSTITTVWNRLSSFITSYMTSTIASYLATVLSRTKTATMFTIKVGKQRNVFKIDSVHDRYFLKIFILKARNSNLSAYISMPQRKKHKGYLTRVQTKQDNKHNKKQLIAVQNKACFWYCVSFCFFARCWLGFLNSIITFLVSKYPYKWTEEK